MFGGGLGQIGGQVLADFLKVSGPCAVAHFGDEGRHLLSHPRQHMAPDIGLAKSHGIEQPAGNCACVIQARTSSPAFSS